MMKNRIQNDAALWVAAAALWCAGCANLSQQGPATPSNGAASAPPKAASQRPPAPQASNADPRASSAAPAQPRQAQAEIFPGTGAYVDPKAAAAGTQAATEDGQIRLNFKAAELSEVVKAILGDLLKVNYIIDEKVKGQVTLETSRPLNRDALIPTLEAVLRTQGAVLIQTGNLYRVVPQTAALTGGLGAQPRLLRGRGFQVVVVPLQHIAAKEIEKILKPLQAPNTLVQIDSRRNLLILAGTETEVAQMLQTVETFDVDQLRGTSVGLFRLLSVDAKTLRTELEQVFGEGADGAGMLRFITLERLNALLVITPQPRHLETVQQWIRRLDRTDEGAGSGLHVYYVQNSRATHLADVLAPLFGIEQQRQDPQAALRLAPGARAATIQSDIGMGVPTRGGGTGSAASADRAASAAAETSSGARAPEGRPVALRTTVEAPSARSSADDLEVGAVTIIADDQRNALIVKANATDYAKVEQAIRKLDIWPFQVLVEATIVDVELTGELSLGVEWFIKGSLGSKDTRSILDLGREGLAAQVPGFSYTVIDAAGVIRGVLNTLAAESRLKVVASPTTMVMDNHKAMIRVGDQVPIRTSDATSIATSGVAPIIASTIEYRDTGVMLEVIPRVNASGMVQLEIRQEVNDVQRTTSSGIDSPTINQRRINTTVAVQSGETIVLGGLIRDHKLKAESGIPFLHKLPIVGYLFKTETNVSERSELIVLITPTAVKDQAEARAVTEELRQRMKETSIPAWMLPVGKEPQNGSVPKESPPNESLPQAPQSKQLPPGSAPAEPTPSEPPVKQPEASTSG
jgi:general secretion pathway protein D